MSLILQQIYVENQTAGAVTEPTGGSWISAYCLHLGITEPVNGTWWGALAIASAPTPGDLVWDTTTTNWEAEATLWNA